MGSKKILKVGVSAWNKVEVHLLLMNNIQWICMPFFIKIKPTIVLIVRIRFNKSNMKNEIFSVKCCMIRCYRVSNWHYQDLDDIDEFVQYLSWSKFSYRFVLPSKTQIHSSISLNLEKNWTKPCWLSGHALSTPFKCLHHSKLRSNISA